MYVTIFGQKFRHTQPCCCAQTLGFMNKLSKYVLPTLVTFLLCYVVLDHIRHNWPNPLASMIEILADPHKYKDEEVRVFGFIKEFSFGVYLTEDHARLSANNSFISIINYNYNDSDISQYCADAYGFVIGTLKLSPEVNQVLYRNQPQLFIIDVSRILIETDDGVKECYPEYKLKPNQKSLSTAERRGDKP